MITTRLAVAGLAGVLTLGGCGQLTSVGADQPSGESPLTGYLALGYHIRDSEIQFNKDEQQRQTLVTDCMASKGFVYTPVPADVAVIGEATGRTEVIGDQGAVEAANAANQRYVESLSLAQRELYWLTLSNRLNGEEGLTAEDMLRLDGNSDGRISYEESLDDGCRGLATKRVPGVFEVTRALERPLDDLKAAIDSSRRGLTATLTACINASIAPSIISEPDAEAFARASIASTPGGAVGRCLGRFDSTVGVVRTELEQVFFDANREQIERLAVRYTG